MTWRVERRWVLSVCEKGEAVGTTPQKLAKLTVVVRNYRKGTESFIYENVQDGGTKHVASRSIECESSIRVSELIHGARTRDSYAGLHPGNRHNILRLILCACRTVWSGRFRGLRTKNLHNFKSKKSRIDLWGVKLQHKARRKNPSRKFSSFQNFEFFHSKMYEKWDEKSKFFEFFDLENFRPKFWSPLTFPVFKKKVDDFFL